MPIFDTLISRIAGAFTDAKLPYMVIGGQAVLRHGEPRMTQDVDLTVGVAPDKVSDVIGVLARIAIKPAVDQPEHFVRQTHVLPCKSDDTHLQIDLIFTDSPYELGAIARSDEVIINNVSVRFASVEDLIIHKIVAGRPRDLEDVKGILLKNRVVDDPYIHHWLEQFAVVTDEPLVERFDQLHG